MSWERESETVARSKSKPLFGVCGWVLFFFFFKPLSHSFRFEIYAQKAPVFLRFGMSFYKKKNEPRKMAGQILLLKTERERVGLFLVATVLSPLRPLTSICSHAFFGSQPNTCQTFTIFASFGLFGPYATFISQ